MNRKEILDLMIGLSHSQGLYGRRLETLYNYKEEDIDYYNLLLSTWEDCKFTVQSFISFIEEEPVNEFDVEDILRWRKEKENDGVVQS